VSNVLISVVSQFDKKGFTQADKSASALEKSMNRLAKATLGALSTQRILAYSKVSIKAYAEDQRAAALLSNQLKNLGLAYAAVDVESFISKLQAQTGILDDELRPAFAQLARVTGSVAQSQKLMAAAFDASRGAGIGFMDAVDTLSQAYVGNKRGLRQLNLGLTQAELAAMDFDQILNKITKHFKGAGAASLDTFAGKLDLLKVSTENAKESIGEGFVDAFTLIANDQDFKDVLAAIDNAAVSVADMIRGVGVALNKIDAATPSWLKNLLTVEAIPIIGGYISGFSKMGAEARRQSAIGTGGGYYTKVAKDKLAAAAEKRRLADVNKKERERLTILSKQTAEKKAQAALDKANAVLQTAQEKFDEEGIQIQAALMNAGKLTTEELYRLSLKKAIYDLEQAIASEDQKRIAAATAVLEKLNAQWNVLGHAGNAAKVLGTNMAAIGTDNKLVDINNLNSALDILKQMLAIWLQMQGGVFGGTTGGPSAPKKKGPVLPPIFDSSGKITPRGEIVLPPTDESPMEKYLRALEEANATIAKNNEALKPIVESGLFDLYYNAQEFIGAGINPNQMSDAAAKAYSQSQVPINVTVNGAIDPEGTARTIVDVLSRSYGRGALPNNVLILWQIGYLNGAFMSAMMFIRQ